MELIPTRATYAPDEPIEITVAGATEPVTVGLWHLDRLVGEVTGRDSVSFDPPGLGGYGVTSGDAGTAVDVLADPLDRPRYGFVADFPAGHTPDALVDTARRLHLNMIQFYDWAHRYASLVPDTDDYIDPLGRRLSLAAVRGLTAALREIGSESMGYAAVYAVGGVDWEAWQHAGLFTAEGEPHRFTDDLLLVVDPSNESWMKHFAADLRQSMADVGFTGFHLDSYGWPKRAYRADGSVADLNDGFAALLEHLRDEVPDGRLLFNNVNDFPTWSTTRTRQDGTYIEVWAPHSTLAHIGGLVERARAFHRSRTPILAAYVTAYRDHPAEVADVTAQLTMATIFSHGGTHLLNGEGGAVLVDPYYPTNHAAAPTTQDMMRRWYDFLVRYGDLLLDPDAVDVTRSYTGGINEDLLFAGRPVRHRSGARHCLGTGGPHPPRPGRALDQPDRSDRDRLGHREAAVDPGDRGDRQGAPHARDLDAARGRPERAGAAAAAGHRGRPLRRDRIARARRLDDGGVAGPARLGCVIRHRPYGGGDPYRLDPDQRVPAIPQPGEAVTLGALASRDAGRVRLEWTVDGQLTTLAATPTGEVGADGSWSEASAESDLGGHLAAAANRTRRRGVVWQITPPALSLGQSARYRFRAESGPGTRWHTVTPARWVPAPGAVTARGRSRIVAGSASAFAGAGGTHHVRFAIALRPAERVAGFGERFDRVDQRGHRLDVVVFEQYKDQAATGRTYFPMPFAHVIGGDGWGFHVRTGHRVRFDVGATEPDRLWITVDGGDGVEIAFYDGTPADVLDAFLDETGRPEPLPDWVHRLWISGNEWNTQAAVMARADRHRDLDIPYGVMVIEAWSDESTFCAFRDAVYEPGERPLRAADVTYPADGAWPDPKGMVDALHERGVAVLLWQIPLQKTHVPGQARIDAARMMRDGYAIRDSSGRPYRNRGWWFPNALMPDFTNPAARSWWQDKRRYLLDDIGVDGFKTDGGEHAWGADLRYHDGTTGAASNNRYPVAYAQAYHDLLVTSGKAPVTFSRSGFTGAQRFGCTWAGDENSTWPAFRASITAGITAGLCGVTYWGWDLAGFSGDVPDPELYLRATQAACFMPIMQYHSEFNFHRRPSRDRTPWNIAERFDRPDVVAEFRRWAYVREALVGYLSAQARTGRPLMRAMALEVPDDVRVWAHPMQFFLGADLLVAPVTEPGATSIEVYLPAGAWRDLSTGRPVAAGVVTRPVPLTDVAVYVRERAAKRFAPVTAAIMHR